MINQNDFNTANVFIYSLQEISHINLVITTYIYLIRFYVINQIIALIVYASN